MPFYNFHNVELCVEADTPKEAYTKLCNALSADDSIEYCTNAYTDADREDIEISTSTLFPE